MKNSTVKLIQQHTATLWNRFITQVWPRWYPWIRYSGASITLVVNPFNWRWLPWAENAVDAGVSITDPNYRGVVFGWLFLVVKLWIDDDTW